MVDEQAALYRLPDLRSDGEKKFALLGSEDGADAAHKLIGAMYAATHCPDDGADLTPLQGRAGLLIPLGGKRGQKAMKRVAERLCTLGIAIRWTDTRDMPDGWTPADWTGTPDEFKAWAKGRTKDYERAEKKQNGSHVLGEIFYRSMSEVEARAINWLWPGRIAKGKVSMIVGNPGLGKSQVCASLASVVSNGGAWPVDRTICQQGSVVILSAEDDAEDTIKPRLEAAGANMDNVFILDAIRCENEQGEEGKRGFNLSIDTARLGALLDKLDDSALVIIDPITAYLGDTDSHKNAEVRALLAPLAEMAAAQQVAVIAVSHLTKSSGMDALLRVQGSIGFAAAARAVWGVAKDKDNPQRRLFMPLKNNIGTDVNGFAYTVEGVRLAESSIETSHVMWESEIITQTSDEVFGTSDQSHEERRSLSDAKEFLRSLLINGPVKKNDISRDAEGAGHSWATIRRAQQDLGVIAYKDEFKGSWRWRLP